MTNPKAVPRKDIIVGEIYSSREPVEIRTLLGSCVAACLFDPVARIGGMNHFMLPFGAQNVPASARYGVHAMELLINQIITSGGDRRRLQAKVFGGANLANTAFPTFHVGRRNADFVVEFLAVENIPLVGRLLGGQDPLRVHFFPQTGKAFVKAVRRERVEPVLLAEQRQARRLAAYIQQPTDVTLF